MDNNILTFTNEKLGKVRTIIQGEEVWFIGKDVSEILGYKDTADAIKTHVDEEDKCIFKNGEIPTFKIAK